MSLAAPHWPDRCNKKNMREGMTMASHAVCTTQIAGALSSTRTSTVYLNTLSEMHLMIVLVRAPARRPRYTRARRVSVTVTCGGSA